RKESHLSLNDFRDTVIVSSSILASWKKGKVKVGSTKFEIKIELIASATGLPADGDIYFKHSLKAKMGDFLKKKERVNKYQSRFEHDSLPTPWDRVT
ncbi:hypothetical protein KI387_028160, partial [Taxus chinensis]